MDLEKLKKKTLADITNANEDSTLEEIRVRVLGRKGQLTDILKSLKTLSLEEKKKLGPLANKLRTEFEEALNIQKKTLEEKKTKKHLDVTKPGKRVSRGHLHPLTLVDEDVRKIFSSMNFSVVEGPEIESEFYNFDALNIPANHPARDLWDTFWIRQSNSGLSASNLKEKLGLGQKTPNLLLRTHTSPVQIRYMEKHNPPFQIIVPGRVFRYEATDASHEINFYQVEGLMIGHDVTLANFKFIVEEFFKKFFASAGEKIEFRFRPSYFPFVEPGLEVDIRIKGGKWLEVMGAGMVHRNVFDAVRYNPDEVQGFAFGMGLDRLAMIKYRIPDIRLFYSGDLRFIKQF